MRSVAAFRGTKDEITESVTVDVARPRSGQLASASFVDVRDDFP